MDPNQHVGDGRLTMGDNVMMRDTDLTRALGIARATGSIFGETRPSTSGVEVMGDCADDFAVCVHLDSLKLEFWFSADLVEFVDHAPGSTMEIGGTHYVRDVDGRWHECEPGEEGFSR